MPESSSNAIANLVERLAAALLSRKLIMATAESCTGGWISQSLTALAGSSNWFDTGFVTYSNAAKQRLLNVPAELFMPDGPGAVSEATVRAMTAGAIANSRATLAVAVSGIAGPDVAAGKNRWARSGLPGSGRTSLLHGAFCLLVIGRRCVLPRWLLRWRVV